MAASFAEPFRSLLGPRWVDRPISLVAVWFAEQFILLSVG